MWKRAGLIMISASFFLSTVCPASVFAASLAWDPPPEQVDGYIVYYGTSQTSQSQSVDVGNITAYSLDNLPLSESVQYFLSVAAYNAAGEGPKAGPVAYTPADTTPPSPPTGFEIVRIGN